MNLNIFRRQRPIIFENTSESRSITLSEDTMRGFLLSGKWQKLETQFIEKPINEFSGRTPAPPFDEMETVHRQDGDVSFALDLHTAIIAGRGYHIESSNPKISEMIMEFLKTFELPQFLEFAIKESLGYGNSLFRYQNPDDFTNIEWMPISTLKAVHWKDGKILAYEFSGIKLVPAEQILHLRWRRLGASPFGFGLIEPLVQTRNYTVIRDKKNINKTRQSIMNIKAEMQDTGRKIMQRYVPRHLITIQEQKGPLQQIVDALRSKLKSLEPQEDIISPIPISIQEMNSNLRAIDWESWEKLFRNEIITTLENPAIRIFTEPGFTKANSDAAIESVQMLLKGFATYIASQIENVIIRPWYESNPWINSDGTKVSWKDAMISFVFGPEETPEITLSEFIQIGNQSMSGFGLSETEYRMELKNRFGINIDPENKEKSPVPLEAQQLELSKMELQDKKELREIIRKKIDES